MNDAPTSADRTVDDYTAGDTVTVYYESVHGDTGNTQAVTLRVKRAETVGIAAFDTETGEDYYLDVDGGLAVCIKKEDTHGNARKVGYPEAVVAEDESDDEGDDLRDATQDLEALRNVAEGDRVRVRYESVYAENGNRQTVEGEVLDVDVHEWYDTDTTTFTVEFRHDGAEDDGRESLGDYDGDDVATRQFEATVHEGEVATVHLRTRNGARWNEISAVHPDPVLTVEGDDTEDAESADESADTQGVEDESENTDADADAESDDESGRDAAAEVEADGRDGYTRDAVPAAGSDDVADDPLADAVDTYAPDEDDDGPEVMTDGGTDYLPDEGDRVAVVYESRRSGNEVRRSGRVSQVDTDLDADASGEWIVTVGTDTNAAGVGTAVAVVGGKPALAVSVTFSAGGLDRELTPEGGSTYVFGREVERVEELGQFLRFEDETPEVMTDGGRDVDEAPRSAEVAASTTATGELRDYEVFDVAAWSVQDSLERLAERYDRGPARPDGGRSRGYEVDAEAILTDDPADATDLRGRSHEALRARLDGLGEVKRIAAECGNGDLYHRVKRRREAIRRELSRRQAERRKGDARHGRFAEGVDE